MKAFRIWFGLSLLLLVIAGPIATSQNSLVYWVGLLVFLIGWGAAEFFIYDLKSRIETLETEAESLRSSQQELRVVGLLNKTYLERSEGLYLLEQRGVPVLLILKQVRAMNVLLSYKSYLETRHREMKERGIIEGLTTWKEMEREKFQTRRPSAFSAPLPPPKSSS